MKETYCNKKTSRRFISMFLVICTGIVSVMYTSVFPVTATSSSPSVDSSSVKTASVQSAAIPPSCDEAYYAVLDYYGNPIESSVVKSYLTNGNSRIIDYGVYEQIINLTDDRQPMVSDDTVIFDLSEDIPQRFYFEGKTKQPFHDLPWTISLSYRLNGVPTPADQLAGKTGLVEINLDVVPNPSASEYNRNNLVLIATAVFNADDILSLEAEGAQVQLIGNLRSVLYLVLPGEEQHFVIKVGSNDFSFDGMFLLAVPATLAQLDQISDLRNVRDEVEDSYHAICDSLDVILDALDGMSGSLNTTADGLDKLNSARNTISTGKDNVYSKADQALDSLNIFTDALDPAVSHLETASNALTDVTDSLTALTKNIAGLKPELENIRSVIKKLQEDTENIRKLAKDVEYYNSWASSVASSLEDDLDDLGNNLDDLTRNLYQLKMTLKSVNGISKVDPINVGGMTTAAEVMDAVDKAQQAYNTYRTVLFTNGLTEDTFPFKSFLMHPQYGGKSESEANNIIALLNAASDPNFAQQLQLMETVNKIIPTINHTIQEVNTIISGIAGPVVNVVDDLQSLSLLLGDSGLSSDLESMSRLAYNLLAVLKNHKGELALLTEHLDELGNLAIRVSQNADNALDLIQKLNDTVNSYVPDAQESLSDVRNLSEALTESLKNANDFLRSAESLLRSSDSDLDSGTKEVLNGLAETLRRSSDSLAETYNIRKAKDDITNLIEDEWNKYTGDENNLLMMDSEAKPVSLTSPKNNAPSSVQYIMRSQEIKVDNSKDIETSPKVETDNGNFWVRVKAMFVGIWNAITGLFRHY